MPLQVCFGPSRLRAEDTAASLSRRRPRAIPRRQGAHKTLPAHGTRPAHHSRASTTVALIILRAVDLAGAHRHGALYSSHRAPHYSSRRGPRVYAISRRPVMNDAGSETCKEQRAGDVQCGEHQEHQRHRRMDGLPQPKRLLLRCHAMQTVFDVDLR